MKFHVVIPARYDSVRFPGKALVDIAGKPMIQHVYERAQQSGAASVTIATDDQRIIDAAHKFNGNVCLTATTHNSGTERIAEAVGILDLDANAIVVNVQGDEPLIPPSIIAQVAENLAQNKQAAMATLCTSILKTDDLFNSNIVKVVRDKNHNAIYFSRAVIPWNRDAFNTDEEKISVTNISKNYFRHIGIYAYTVKFIHQYLAMEISPLEEIEKLEQLRTLWHGKKIHVDIAKEIPAQDINSKEDLEAIKKFF